MKHFAWFTFVVIITFLTFNALVDICEARGGRGRGGGSFGGIFGGWRKYKKPASNSNSRRTISGSPMHTTATKSVSSGSSYSSSNSLKQPKQETSYPKQQMPSGTAYNSYGGYYGSNAAGTAPLPPGSTYYPNMGAMPPGAIYSAQPMRSSSGTGDFLVGMLAGHMTSNMLFGPRHHVTHVYPENPDKLTQNNPKIIVINNGEVTTLNATNHSTTSPEGYWPTDTVIPLEPFNDTVTPADTLQPGKTPLFQRIQFNNSKNIQMTQAAQPPVSNVQFNSSALVSPSPPEAPPNGIICMPIKLNETNPNDPSKVQQVERIICFPAPPPQSTPSPAANTNCVLRTFIETDPNDPSQTIEVPKEICATSTTTSEPRQVAGEIGESVANKTDEMFSVETEKEPSSNEQASNINAENDTYLAVGYIN